MNNFIPLIVFIIALGLAIFFYRRSKRKEDLFESINISLFLVLMPKYDLKDDELVKKEEKQLIAYMEQVYANFLSLHESNFFKRIIYGEPRVALEIASETGGSDISFYVAVPRYLGGAFEKYINGVYPRAVIEKVPKDYTIFEPGNANAGAYLKLEGLPLLPINTYKNLEKDPLATITNALSKISSEEGAAVQVIVRAFPQGEWRRIGYQVSEKIKHGKTVHAAAREALRSPLIDAIADLTSSFFSKKPEEKKDEQQMFGAFSQYEQHYGQRSPQVDEKTLEAIQSKLQRQVFETNIRFIASAKTKERAQEIIGHLTAGLGQFALFSLNSFKAMEFKGPLAKKRLRKFINDFIFRRFSNKRKMLLDTEELTSMYHFPTRYTETPYIKSAKSGFAAPPPELRKSQPKESSIQVPAETSRFREKNVKNAEEMGINIIGQVNFRGETTDVYFATKNDRRRHFYIVGQTGTGKTSLIREMIRQDIQNGEGVAVIDPHGDLIEDTLANIPKDRVEDVVLFEPFDTVRPVGLNMLEYDTAEQKDFAVQEMIAIFNKLFPPEIVGPMFEHYMRNAMLALMTDPTNPGTLVEIPRMFTDEEFLQSRLEILKDPIVRNFWLKEWKQTTGSTKSDMLGYVVSKVGRFIENEMMRNIIGQSHSGFDLGKIMDEGKIFLANLSKGQTGEINSSLLGLILVSKMQMAAMRRGRIPEEERKDFYLYIDEFQNFTTDSIATILSEARKYRLNLIIAHQYIPQLQEEIKNAVLGNVGSIGAFRVGATDAEFLEKQFEPEFSRFDLVNLDNFNVILKLMIDNKVYPPFKMEILKPRQGNREVVEFIKKISTLEYGRPKAQVEAEIMERSKLNI